jgi:hypothetical protein
MAEQAALEVAISMVEVVNDIRNGTDLNHPEFDLYPIRVEL